MDRKTPQRKELLGFLWVEISQFFFWKKKIGHFFFLVHSGNGKWGPRIESMYFLLKMGIFHGYVSLPEGRYLLGFSKVLKRGDSDASGGPRIQL